MGFKEDIQRKSIDFAVRVVRLARYLQEDKKDFVISRQILKSGTSIGANIREAQYGQSAADFVAKLHIALKEGAETQYWVKDRFGCRRSDKVVKNGVRRTCRHVDPGCEVQQAKARNPLTP